MKKLAILFALTLCVALAGCNQPAPPQGGEPTQTPSGTVSTPPAEEPTEPAPPADGSTTPTPTEGGQTATLYIGTKANGFTEYPMTYEGELTPETLIIDRFGEDVSVQIVDKEHFKETATVALSNNFYGWVFASGGKMRILGSEKARAQFQAILDNFLV